MAQPLLEVFGDLQRTLQPWTGVGTVVTAAGTAGLAALKWGGRLMRWRWPGRETWGSDASRLFGAELLDNSRKAYTGGVHDRWTTFAPQEIGMWFRLDLGRVATIERVVFDHARSFKDYPSKYQLDLSVDGENFQSKTLLGPIDAHLPARRVRYIRVSIVEPQREEYGHWWSIHDIRVYERRLPFWLHVIK